MSSNPGQPPPRDADEKPQFGIVHRRRATDNALTENVDWSRDLVEHSRDLLCVHDLDGRLLSVNPVPARLLGYTVDEILKVPMRELLDPKFRDQFDEYIRQLASAGEATGILAVLTRTGQRRLWEYHCTLRTQGVEKPVVRGIAHDVTERIASEKALRESNKKLVETAAGQGSLLHSLQLFRTLLDNSNDAIEVVDPATMRFLDVNEKSCADLGYTRDELLSMTVFDIDPQLTPDGVVEDREQLRETGFLIKESVHRRRDGTTFPIEVNLKRVRLNGDSEYLVAISRDLTERKQRDDRLQEYERVLESLDEMIVVVNREYRYVLANRSFLRYRGLTKEELIGRHMMELLHADSFQQAKPKMDEAFSGKVVDYEMDYNYPQVGERNLDRSPICPLRSPKHAAARLEESEKRSARCTIAHPWESVSWIPTPGSSFRSIQNIARLLAAPRRKCFAYAIRTSRIRMTKTQAWERRGRCATNKSATTTSRNAMFDPTGAWSGSIFRWCRSGNRESPPACI